MFYPDEFYIFWDLYPRKISKKNAYNAWKKIPKDVKNTVILWLKEYMIKRDKENTEIQMIPYPASWLNAERYYDEIIIDEAQWFKEKKMFLQKKEEEKIKKEDQQKIKDLDQKKYKISPVILQTWRFAIKLEIISKFPNIWQSQSKTKFYYNARIRYYINKYNNE